MSSPNIDIEELQKRLRYDETDAESLLNRLISLREVSIPFRYLGLCNNAGCQHVSSYLAPFWPRFSGNRRYPIPHPNLNPKDAFNRVEGLWGDRAFLHLRNPDDQYRRNRWDYLDWMIEQLEEHLQWLSVNTN